MKGFERRASAATSFKYHHARLMGLLALCAHHCSARPAWWWLSPPPDVGHLTTLADTRRLVPWQKPLRHKITVSVCCWTTQYRQNTQHKRRSRGRPVDLSHADECTDYDDISARRPCSLPPHFPPYLPLSTASCQTEHSLGDSPLSTPHAGTTEPEATKLNWHARVMMKRKVMAVIDWAPPAFALCHQLALHDSWRSRHDTCRRQTATSLSSRAIVV